jgi:surfeit locus 1 family protein
MGEHVGSLEMHRSGDFKLWRLFSRRWILATLLVIAAAAVMVRLGIWQLDRLDLRRAFNARVQAQMSQPQLELAGDALSADLASMEYRSVSVRGQYDFSRQVALRNQAWDNQAGVRLLTPLKIEGSDNYMLVERGWVPGIESTPEEWRQYDEPGIVEVRGIIRRSQSKPDFGRRADLLPAPGEEPLRLWHFANVEGIASQLPYPLLPVYIQQAPDLSWMALPYRSLPELELTEGPHMGYALQWFSFAALLLAGYPFFVRKREIKH